MTTSFSFVSYTGNGTTQTFNVPFQYISKTHVEVYTDGLLRTNGISWDNDSTIRLNPAPASGSVVRLERNTPKTTALVDFQDAGVLTETALDLNTRQGLFIVQEAFDEASNVVSQAVAAAVAASQVAGRSVPTVTPSAIGRFLVGRASDSYGWANNLTYNESTGDLVANGSVGIGTTDLSSRLNVGGSLRVAGQVNSSIPGSGILQSALDSTASAVWQVGSDGSAIYVGTQTNHPLRVTTNNVERLRLTPAGRFGVNTTNPAAILHVVGAASTTPLQAIGAAGGLYVDFNGLSQNYYDANDHIFRDGGTVERFRLTATGQLRAASGSLAAPAYSFSGDTDTGILNSNPNEIGFVTNGVLRGKFDTTAFQVSTQDGVRLGAIGTTSFARVGSAFNGETAFDISYDRASGITTFNIGTVGGSFVERMRIASGSPVTIDGKPVGIRRSTAQATTSGTAIDFLNIPAGARRITVIFRGVSLSGTEKFLIQVGAGSILTSTYTSSSSGPDINGFWINSTSTAGFILGTIFDAANNYSGRMELLNLTGNLWVASGSITNTSVGAGGRGAISSGDVLLSGTLDRLRITNTGSNTFDAGDVNILVEYEHV